MHCFFDWEKASGSNAIYITAIYFDAPKENPDKRIGLHSTELTNLMRAYVLSHLTSGTFSKSKVLQDLGLLYSENGSEDSDFLAFLDKYNGKVFRLMQSTFTQLWKRDLALIDTICYNEKTGVPITNSKILDSYRRIKSETVKEMKERSTYHIFRHKRWAEYQQKLDAKTYEQFTLCIRERYLVSIHPIPPESIEPVTKASLLTAITQDMLTRFEATHTRGIGINRDLVRFKQHIQKLFDQLIRP